MNNDNIKILTNKFFDVYMEYKILGQANLEKDIVFTKSDDNLNDFYIKLVDFYGSLKMIKNNNFLIRFFYINYDELMKIKKFLFKLETLKSRLYYDLIFKEIFYMNKRIDNSVNFTKQNNLI